MRAEEIEAALRVLGGTLADHGCTDGSTWVLVLPTGEEYEFPSEDVDPNLPGIVTQALEWLAASGIYELKFHFQAHGRVQAHIRGYGWIAGATLGEALLRAVLAVKGE